MLRPTAASPLFSLLRIASAGTIVLVTALSCSDTKSPTAGVDGVIRVSVDRIDILDPDSVKNALAPEASANSIVPIGAVANVLTVPRSAAMDIAPSCSGGDAFAGYTKSKVSFVPEEIPKFAAILDTSKKGDDGIIRDMPLGFNFSFQGVSYDRVNVYMNGFLRFGTLTGTDTTLGYAAAGSIASVAKPNNIIALSWTDWSPQYVQNGIRWETRGTAPNRRFVLQYDNVPEFSSANKYGVISPLVGRLTSQVVLSEGSNDITIYTTEQTVKNSSHFVTQGIENATGTQANFDSVLNVKTGIFGRRVTNFYQLQNDAVRFSLVQTKDLIAPTVTAPSNISVGNDLHLATAVVAVGSPSGDDNCGAPTFSGVRSDGLALDAPYPVGVTTITWTAKDAAGNTASATQTVEVLDKEAPRFNEGLRAALLLQVNATSPSGAVVTYPVNVIDNVGVTSVSCEPASGSLFPVGPTDVNCTASDAAGNTASESFSVTVIGARQQLATLIDDVRNMRLPNGTAQPLVNQLRAAYSQEDGSAQLCKKMSDFISMVQKKGSNIEGDYATSMVDDATRVMGAMGCSDPLSGSLSRVVSFPQL